MMKNDYACNGAFGGFRRIKAITSPITARART
jgi:hypothetical protein